MRLILIPSNGFNLRIYRLPIYDHIQLDAELSKHGGT